MLGKIIYWKCIFYVSLAKENDEDSLQNVHLKTVFKNTIYKNTGIAEGI